MDKVVLTVHATNEEEFNDRVKILGKALKEDYSLSTQINKYRVDDTKTLVCFTIIIEKNKRKEF